MQYATHYEEGKKVSFKKFDLKLAGLLFLPDGFDADAKYPAVVVTHPGGGVKEQCSSLYAWHLARAGYVALAFDASHQGESEGLPRCLEDPFSRVEDIRSAVDYLVTLPYVDEERIGAMGVCAGGGYTMSAIQTDVRIKAGDVLYVSGEESAYQLKLRAQRLASNEQYNDNCFIVCETNLDDIFVHIANVEPDLVVIDSIQTIATDDLESAAGQVRECAARILKFAKESGTPIILIGHITKEGSLAGPKVLEHIVDTVIQFEGDQHYMYRILRAIKNRFGSTSELGIYEMLGTGLRQVTNPSELLLSTQHQGLSGVAIAAAIEGMRPFLIETQSLVSTSAYATPMRSTTGFDSRRLNMLLAVLEKKVGFKLGQKDVFLNIAGGLKVNDPAMDLAVISAIISSNMDMAIDMQTCMTGEIGLSGEIRPVSRIEQRIMEAEKLGFNRILIPNISLKSLDVKKLRIQVCPVSRVDEAFRLLFK